MPNEGANGSYNGFCINLAVTSVGDGNDGNENSVGFDGIDFAAFITERQFSSVNAFISDCSLKNKLEISLRT